MVTARMILPLLGLLALLTSVSTNSVAYNYQPLGMGSQWTYEGPGGGIHVMTIMGERTVLGVVTRIRHQAEDGQTYENYWTSDDDDHLYLHGAYNYEADLGWAFEPPIKYVDAPLFAGKTWITEDIYMYGLDGTPWGGEPFDYPVRVYSEGLIEVPAGEFYSYGLGYDIGAEVVVSRDGRSYTLLGRALEIVPKIPDDNTTNWFCDGVGEPKFGYIYGEQHLLLSYDLPVSVVTTTWGRVRALFRNGQ